ncbi:hypothetical protein DFH06DRAFT_1338493 [Mycena polygramma]|nr:hypothetical protein DFH06DRAFT_1338493 [Mycena polygramma]
MPPKAKPASSSASSSPGAPEFPIQYTKIDDVSYRITDQYGRALDPYIKLRGRSGIDLKNLLVNKTLLNEIDKGPDAVDIPRLLVANLEALDFNRRAWYEEYAPEFNGVFQQWKYLMPDARHPPPEPLPPKWKYPLQATFFSREEPPLRTKHVPKVELPASKGGRVLRSGDRVSSEPSPSNVPRGPPKGKAKAIEQSSDEDRKPSSSKNPRKRHRSPDDDGSEVGEASGTEVVTKSSSKKKKVKVEKRYEDGEMPDTSTNIPAYYDHPLNDFPSTNNDLQDVPVDERWKFDTRVVTANALTRASARNLPKTPRGAPWFPSNQKTPITTTLGTAGHQLQLQKYPPMVRRFKSFPKISQTQTREIFKPVLELLRDPGFSCIECILSNYYCEFRGFNHPCTACESKAHKACSFKYSEAQLERARLELAPWIDTGTRQTLYMIAELHASMVRATIAHQAACFETQEMADKLAAFNEHADEVIKLVGVDSFNNRFTESTSTVSMRDWVARLTDRANFQVVKQSARLDPKHVATFNPDRTAHYGVTDSGAGPSTPPFSQVAGGSSGDGDDGLDLGQEALVPPTSRSSTPGGEEVVSLETEDPIEEEVVPEVEEEAAVTPKPRRRERSSSSSRGSPPAPPKKPLSSASPKKPLSSASKKFPLVYRSDTKCFLLDVESWDLFWEDHGPQMQHNVMFGRDKYPLASLQSTVPRAFEYLRRCYFNKTRARYQERLAGISDRQALMNVYQNWTLHKFGRQAMNLIERRLEM